MSQHCTLLYCAKIKETTASALVFETLWALRFQHFTTDTVLWHDRSTQQTNISLNSAKHWNTISEIKESIRSTILSLCTSNLIYMSTA
jgi:hypothetical protein